MIEREEFLTATTRLVWLAAAIFSSLATAATMFAVFHFNDPLSTSDLARGFTNLLAPAALFSVMLTTLARHAERKGSQSLLLWFCLAGLALMPIALPLIIFATIWSSDEPGTFISPSDLILLIPPFVGTFVCWGVVRLGTAR